MIKLITSEGDEIGWNWLTVQDRGEEEEMRSPELRTDENRERNHQGETDTRLYISILLQRDDCTKCQIYKEEGYNTINHLKKKKKE